MAWRLTGSPDEFLDASGAHLRADPVHNTVLLTVLGTLRERGSSAFGNAAPVFGWHESSGGDVDGAFLQTPPFPLLVARLPEGTAAALIEALSADGRQPNGANVVGSDEAGFIAAWTAVTGGSATARQRSRLFRLARLIPPDPWPAGAARVASQDDFALLVEWHTAFVAGIRAAGENPDRIVADRLSHSGLMIWEADGLPVAMAGRTREVAGVVRVADVYTPREHRQRGYGGAITSAVTQAALDGGAAEVVLFTDLANPTSNALYQRLGYQPIGDRVVLSLEPVAADQAYVTAGPGPSS